MRASLELESDNGGAPLLLFFCGLLASSGLFGLFYNGVGQLALLTTPGAKPGLDDNQTVLIEVLGTILGIAGFLTIRQRRTTALRRIDSEFAFGELRYSVADGLNLTREMYDVATKNRVLVLYGDGEELAAGLRKAAAYRRRFVSSGILVVAVCESLPKGVGGSWLATAKDVEEWEDCLEDLLSTGGEDARKKASGSCEYVLVGKSGRVRGTGVGFPGYDEVVSFVGVQIDLSTLPARAPLVQAAGEEQQARDEIMAVHDAFYEALIEGKWEDMRPLWEAEPAGDEAATPTQPQKRVPWESVLSDRAAVLNVVDVDLVFTEPNLAEATVTSIEVVAGSPSMFNDGGPGGKGTLLATKRFRRFPADNGPWRLVSHQTIPYCRNTLAYQSLRCTCDGCLLFKR